MKKIILWLVMVVSVQVLSANVELEIKEHFNNKFESIRFVIKNNCNNKEKLFHDLENILVPIFDFELMAKLSLGKTQWKKMSKKERIKFIDTYTQRMKTSYAKKLESFDDEKVNITSVLRKKNRIIINSTIKTTDKILDVIYKLYKPKKAKEGKEEWLIYDVEIIGISILKADKAQFKDFLRTKSIDELMLSLASQSK